MKDGKPKTGERENPRTRRVRELILETAIEVLLDQGAQGVTAANVAERADVARTTIYRHWPDQRSLLLATIENLATGRELPEAIGPLDDDVRRTLRQLRERLAYREVHSVFGALAGFAEQEAAFGDAQRMFVEGLNQPMVAVLQAAKNRGELAVDTDCAFEATMLTGPLLHQHLALRNEITDHLIGEVADRWLAARTGPVR